MDLSELHALDRRFQQLRRATRRHERRGRAIEGELLAEMLQLQRDLVRSGLADEIRSFLDGHVACEEARRYLVRLYGGDGPSPSGTLRGSAEAILSMAEGAPHGPGGSAGGTAILPAFRVQCAAWKRFFRDVRAHHRAPLSLDILGYGEISTVLAFGRQDEEAWLERSLHPRAFKKMPPFPDRPAVEAYVRLGEAYHRALQDNLGIDVPRFRIKTLRLPDGAYRVYHAQDRIPGQWLGDKVLARISEPEGRLLLRAILDRIRRVARYNRDHAGDEVTLDAQVSNWAVVDFDPEAPRLTGTETLLYLDTSTPLMRENGKEMLDTEIFLKSMPSFLVWIVRALFLQDVLDRYYDPRLNTIDLIANLIKEGHRDRIPGWIETANDFFAAEMGGFGIDPITSKEIDRYYREDAIIWSLVQGLRRIERFLKVKVLRKPYPFRIPPPIQRYH